MHFPLFLPLWAETRETFCLGFPDHLIKQSCGSSFRFPLRVSVDVHCGTYIRVSEQFLHILWCCTVGEQIACECVSQRMKMEILKRHPRKRTTIKPILRIRDEGSAEIRRPFFLRTSEKGAKSRLTVLTPAIWEVLRKTISRYGLSPSVYGENEGMWCSTCPHFHLCFTKTTSKNLNAVRLKWCKYCCGFFYSLVVCCLATRG